MTYTSSIKYLGGLRTEATHLQSSSIVQTDAPVDNNGNGALFSPTDLAATSLASCMLTVMGIAANASNIAYQNVEAKVKKVMASSPRRIDKIYVTIEVHHHWTKDEKRRLQQVALTCPVGRSLHPSIEQIVEFKYPES